MIAHQPWKPPGRKPQGPKPQGHLLRSVGRIGFALAGGGLFALLAWEPSSPRGTDEIDERPHKADRPDRLSLHERESRWIRRDGGSANVDRDDGALRSADPWGVAMLETSKRFDTNEDVDIGSEPGSSTEVRTWFTATADGGLRGTPIRDSRGPP